jgi:hemoglobin
MQSFRTLIAVLLAVGSLHAIAADDALYRDLGGAAGIRRIVADLLPAVQADTRINASFDGVDLENLAEKLEEQFCEVSGGPCRYSGKDMQTIHEDLALNQAHFNALVEDLQSAMERNRVPSRVQNRLLARLAPMQRDVVTK